jgi:hypothetical protein
LFGLLDVAALNVFAGAETLTVASCTPEVCQLGRNAQRPIKEYEGRIVNDVAHRWHKSSEISVLSMHSSYGTNYNLSIKHE